MFSCLGRGKALTLSPVCVVVHARRFRHRFRVRYQRLVPLFVVVPE